ncbi:unnamed protein product [Callosobruchus maculatus]|uniref:RRM domain-containing protein n=1 Tax=Callosobruchus maculatus TaxID=64391 RepID=A0A653DL44_CALMS|nr:unnamed protein product [Callosobruchus maculatus]
MRRRSTRTRASEKQSSSETNQNARKEQCNSVVESDTEPNENNKNLQETSEEGASTTPTGTPTKSRRKRPVLWRPNTEDESSDTQNDTNQDIVTCQTDQLIVTNQVENQEGDFQNSSEQNIRDGSDEGKFNESNIQNNGTSADQNETENDNVQGTTDSPHKDTKYPDANDVQHCNENEMSKDNEANAVGESESDNFQSEYSIGNSGKVDEGLNNEKSEDDKKEKPQSATGDGNKSIKLPPKKITLKRLQSKVTLDDNQTDKQQKSSSGDNNSMRKNSTENAVGKEEVTSADQDKTLKRRHSDTRPEDREEKIRRSSVTSCENKKELEAKVLKQHPKIRLVRHRSAENVKDDTSNLLKSKKSSRWGCSSGWFSNINASLYKVDVDALKIVCPTIEFLNEEDVKLDSIPKEKERRDHEKKVETKITNEDIQVNENHEEIDASSNLFTHNRKVSIIDAVRDSGQVVQNSSQAVTIGDPPREPSPANHPVSQVLYITNLVRPFTVKQLKDLLQRTGRIVDEGFWTDKIKSKCYVQYETEEEAVATRNALHGINWPISNGKKLNIDYATVEDLEKAKNPVPAMIATSDVAIEKENKQVPADKGVKGMKVKEEKEDTKKRDFIRDWDQNKEDLHKRSRSRSRERVRKHSRRSYTPEGYPKKHKKHEEAVPQKLMDDLFLKTKTTPSIYWQPLSPEEIAKKQHQRLVCMEEYKRRIEEKRERNRENRHGPYRRR